MIFIEYDTHVNRMNKRNEGHIKDHVKGKVSFSVIHMIENNCKKHDNYIFTQAYFRLCC